VQINRKGYPEKWAAEEIKEVSPTLIEVKIRSGMRFHDGKPVTAEDIRFSFDLFRTEKATRFYPFASVIKEVQVLDGLTVRFVLNEPYAPFLMNTLGVIPILPKHIWEGLPQKAGLSKIQDWPNNPPIGSGPFKLDYWRRGEEMKLTRNDAHFKKPHIEGIVKINYADVNGAAAGLERGENDMVSWNVGPVQAKRLAQLKNIKVVSVRSILVLGMDYNGSREPFNDPRVRRALAYAIPKSRIVEVLYEGRADVGQAVIAPVNDFWHNPRVEKFNLDMAKARKLLQEAGYVWDSQGKIYSPRK
jgi:peptide/nickel transport system substrate-binding protein